jgi:glucose-1-phosphate adenylyltransferase
VKDVVTAILGGGQGTRLWPLTRDRSKPAVPVGGKFRLIDIPISNSLHAGIEQIYVLTQFNSASLHRHIAQTYRFDNFRGGFVDILAAEQGLDARDWYQGTADAIRQNLHRLGEAETRDVLILAGDHLYLMDLAQMVERHRESAADVTVAVNPVPRSEAHAFGIMRIDDTGFIAEFVEKPRDPQRLDALAPDPRTMRALRFGAPEGHVLASMGIYVFRSSVLRELLQGTSATDFGRDVLPGAIHTHRVAAYAHPGYWRDIGTIEAFHAASMELALPLPPLDLYSPERPIYTHPRFLPGAKITSCTIENAILCEGSILSECRVVRSIVGIRAILRRGSVVEDSVVMGGRRFHNRPPTDGSIPVGIGPGCHVRRALIDMDARIGEGSRLVNERNVQEADGDGWFIRGGIIVVPRDGAIPPGTVV